MQQLGDGIGHPRGNPRRTNTLDGQHTEREAITQVVDTEGQRVIAALLAPEQAHALPDALTVTRCIVGAVPIVEQGAEQRRSGRHATAALGQGQRRVLMAEQGRQATVGGAHGGTHGQCGVHPQRQGVDEHAQRPIGALTPLQAAHQHGTEDHVMAVGKHPQHPRPGQVHQARGADTQLPGLGAQTEGNLAVQGLEGRFDTPAIALHVGEAQRQGRLIDIGEHLAEERLVAGLITQAGLGHIVAVRHRGRQRVPLAKQQCAHFAGDHVHGRVVEGEVVEQQNRHHLVVGGVQAVVQAGQRRLGQVQPVLPCIETRMQLLDPWPAILISQVIDFTDHQFGLAPDHLQRLRQPLPEHCGAQDVMAVDNLLQGTGPGQQAFDTVKGQAGLQQVGVALLGAQVMVENALLQGCQRVDFLHVGSATRHAGDDVVEGRLLQGDQAQHLRGNPFSVQRHPVGGHRHFAADSRCAGQRGQGRLGEQHTHIDEQASLAQALDQRHRQQRVAAQFEEVVVPPYPFHAQHIGPDGRHRGFGLTFRRLECLAEQLRGSRVGQCAAVQLAVAGQRQLSQAQQRQRYHVRRQAGLQGLAQSFDIHRGGLGEPGQQTLAPHQHHGRVDAGLRCEGGFDFAQLYPHAANLHLVVVAAEVIEGAIGIPAHPVTAAVHPCVGLRAERIDEKRLLGQRRAVEVATRHLRPADEQLTGDADRYRLQAFVQHIDAGIGDRPADVQRPARHHLPGGSDHGGFGRPVVVDQGKPWVTLELAQAVAAYQQGAQGRVLTFAAQGLLGHRCRQETDRQRLRQPPVEQFIDMLVGDVRRRQVQRGPGAQSGPDFPGHGVEAETGHAGRLCSGVQREGLAVPVHQVGEGVMLDHHTLRLAGGAGGVDQIRQVLRVQLRQLRVAVVHSDALCKIQVEARHPGRQPGNSSLAHHQCRFAVGQQIGNALCRVGGVYRYIGRARLEHTQQRDHAPAVARQA
ncbi:hypothetical protein D3C76_246780 [compost metagenome]